MEIVAWVSSVGEETLTSDEVDMDTVTRTYTPSGLRVHPLVVYECSHWWCTSVVIGGLRECIHRWANNQTIAYLVQPHCIQLYRFMRIVEVRKGQL